MSAFLKSTSGRVLTTSTGLALLLGGIAAMMGSPAGTPVMCLAVIIAVTGGLFAAGISTTIAPQSTLLMLLAYPVVLFGAIIALGFAVNHHLVIAGFALAAAGLLAIPTAMLSRPAEPPTEPRGHHRFAHRSA